MLAQPPEQEARAKLLDNNPDCIGFWKYFSRRGGNRSTRRKNHSKERREKRQKILKKRPYFDLYDQEHGAQSSTPSPGIEPGPHWWETSALTTAPSLLPMASFLNKSCGMV